MVTSNGVLSRAEGRNPLRTTINYAGICFPTPMKDLEKLGVQHDNIAINFFGWQNDRATVYKISEKATRVPPINLMMTGSREIWHHSYVKSDKNKHFVARPKKISGKKTLLFAVLVNI